MNRQVEFSLSLSSQRLAYALVRFITRNTAFVTLIMDADLPASREK